MIMIRSVVGRDVVVRDLRVRTGVVVGVPEWYEAVVDAPCLDICVRINIGANDMDID